MPFQRAVILGGIPSLIMLTSTYIGLGKEVPDDVSGALQHFAAGVLLCTVGTELLPEIVHAEGWMQNLAAFVGFFLGVAVLILLGNCSPESIFEQDDDEEENGDGNLRGQEGSIHSSHASNIENNDDDDGDDQAGDIFRRLQNTNMNSPTPMQRQQLREQRFVIMGRRFRQRQPIRGPTGRLVVKRSMSLSSLPTLSESEPLMSSTNQDDNGSYTDELKQQKMSKAGPDDLENNSPTREKAKQKNTTSDPTKHAHKRFPFVFVCAVAVDSALDGLLIGIASAAGPSAGPMMSASLSVEMGFLGLTLATALYGHPLHKAALAALVGPVCLVLSAGLGGTMADTLSHSPVAFVGMLSFGASALLFMVAEELLLDAHEDGEHVWWVDLQLYMGFFTSIIAGKFVK